MNSGPGAGQSLEVEEEVVIGRENADLTLTDPEISRRHVLVRPIDRGIEVEDLGSMNGTFVNGERIEGTVELTVGGNIRVGTSEIEVVLDLAAPTVVGGAIPAGDPTQTREVIPDVDRTVVRETPPPQPAAGVPPPPPAGEPPPAPAPPPAGAPAPPAPVLRADAPPPAVPPPAAPPTGAPPARRGRRPAKGTSERPSIGPVLVGFVVGFGIAAAIFNLL